MGPTCDRAPCEAWWLEVRPLSNSVSAQCYINALRLKLISAKSTSYLYCGINEKNLLGYPHKSADIRAKEQFLN